MAVLNVTHQVVHVEKKDLYQPRRIDFPTSEKGSVANISLEIPAPSGFSLFGARFAHDITKDANVRNARLDLLPGGKAVRLTCQMTKNPKGPTIWVAPVMLSVEKRSVPQTRAMPAVGLQLPVPGKVVLPMPMPQGWWVSQQHSLALQMQYADRTFWQTAQLPKTDQFTFNNRQYRLTATEVGNQVQVQVDEVRPGAGPVGN